LIFGASSLAGVSTATSRLSNAVVTGVDVLTYHPSRWLKRQTGPKMLTRPARPKSKLLSIIQVAAAVSDDRNYNGLDLDDVTVINENNDSDTVS
jgi:hypothetical protein